MSKKKLNKPLLMSIIRRRQRELLYEIDPLIKRLAVCSRVRSKRAKKKYALSAEENHRLLQLLADFAEIHELIEYFV